MNKDQRAYDSHDKTSKLLKMNENLYHQRNLYLIKNRKPQFNTFVPLYPHKNPGDPMNKFKLKNENQILFRNLHKIIGKETKPKMNLDYFAQGEKKKLFKIKCKEDERREILEQNKSIYRRLGMVRSYFDSRRLDDIYKEEHPRLMKKLKKIQEGDVLPTITQKQVVQSFATDGIIDVTKSSSINRKKRATTCED